MKIIVFYSSLLFSILSVAQPINQSQLQLQEIMKGESFTGHQPENIRWTADSKKILFDWNPFSQPDNSTYAYDIKTGTTDSVEASFYTTNAEFTSMIDADLSVYTFNGNLYRYDQKAEKVNCLFKSHDFLHNAQYAPLIDRYYFQLLNSLYMYNPDSGEIVEVALLKTGSPETATSEDYLEREEVERFEFLSDKKADQEWKEKHTIFKDWEIPIIYHSSKSVSNIQISGDGEYILFREDYQPDLPKTQVQHHISEDGHSYVANARPKVAEKDPHHKLGIYSIKLDSLIYADFTTLPNIRMKPEYLKLYGDSTLSYESDRPVIMQSVVFSANGKRNVIDVRSYDNKDRWLVTLDLSTGKIEVLDHQHDEAWIGGPGISSWNMSTGILDWMDDNTTIFYQSEESGFSHLYSLNTETKVNRQLTKGNWEVHNVQYLHGKFYLTTNQEHPGSRDFCELDPLSGKLVQLLSDKGNYEVVLSPDGQNMAFRFSTSILPWDLFYRRNVGGSKIIRITDSRSVAFKNYPWYDPKIVKLNDENGHPIYARLYVPEQTNGAGVIFVHGAGYLQNAHNYWSLYHREFMFHNLLRDNGYTILDIDYRASEGYGRDHRTSIYRNMGGADLQDQMIGRQFLIDSLKVDQNRVAIYGGSYGGFITLMALLKEPGKFKCGAALRSVTDWFHYNHEYTSNILNYPESDPLAYKSSSPIYYANNLNDRLLMLHGMVDDNVQFQDVVRLSQKFIELGKTNWELAVFPVESHSFKTASSWNDEYRRILEMFNEELLLH